MNMVIKIAVDYNSPLFHFISSIISFIYQFITTIIIFWIIDLICISKMRFNKNADRCLINWIDSGETGSITLEIG